MKGMVVVACLVTVVGIGPGGRDYLLPAAVEAVREADVLVGGKSALALFAPLEKEHRLLDRDLEGALDYVAAARGRKRVAVLLSGDPCFFSFLPRLRERFGPENLRVIPGVSSVQVACARIGLSWHDLRFTSVHGRGLAQLEAVGASGKVAVLTEERHPPAAVCRFFLERGGDFSTVWVFTDLGLPGELITRTDLPGGSRLEGRGNSIVILLRREDGSPGCRAGDSGIPAGESPGEGPGYSLPGVGRMPDFAAGSRAPEARAGEKAGPENDQSETMAREWGDVVTPGLPDELFLRGEAAISQEEVRALVLCKARLRRGMVVYEIGAGTGSWTVEVARLIAPGTVRAVERNPAAARLVRSNLERFGLSNAVVVEGEAPAACAGFPPADCVLVGGSGGELLGIISAARNWLRPGGCLVLSAVTPDTFSTAWQQLQGDGWDRREAVLLHLSRVVPRGGARIWQGENPVFILRAFCTGGNKGNE